MTDLHIQLNRIEKAVNEILETVKEERFSTARQMSYQTSGNEFLRSGQANPGSGNALNSVTLSKPVQSKQYYKKSQTSHVTSSLMVNRFLIAPPNHHR